MELTQFSKKCKEVMSVDSDSFPTAWVSMTVVDISKLARPKTKVDLSQESTGKGYKKEYRPKETYLKSLCLRCKHEIKAKKKGSSKEAENKSLATLRSPPRNYESKSPMLVFQRL